MKREMWLKLINPFLSSSLSLLLSFPFSLPSLSPTFPLPSLLHFTPPPSHPAFLLYPPSPSFPSPSLPPSHPPSSSVPPFPLFSFSSLSLPLSQRPITTICWGHRDSRLFLACGPALYVVRVEHRVANLQLLCQQAIASTLREEKDISKLTMPSRLCSYVTSAFAPTIKVPAPGSPPPSPAFSRPVYLFLSFEELTSVVRGQRLGFQTALFAVLDSC